MNNIMNDLEKVIKKIIKEEVATPVLAKIDKVDSKDYVCDCVELTNDGSLRSSIRTGSDTSDIVSSETDTVYTRVQIPKLLASKDGGIFLTPNKGTIVLLNFLNGDRNYPIISAVMGGRHSTDSHENKLVIGANGKDLGEILVAICEKVSELTTTGSPTTQTLRPDQVADWKIFVEQELKSLFHIEG